jgi:hypothetical protein
MSRGIIYYNSGTACLLRLAVSIHSLRKYYNGAVTIFCDKDSFENCQYIGRLSSASVISIGEEKWQPPNIVFLHKTEMHELTPYDTTIWLDCDTTIHSNKIEYLFNLAEKFDFVATQFCEWSSKDKAVAVHMGEWESVGIDSSMIDRAINRGKAINAGVFAFVKDAKIMQDWYSFATKGIKFHGMDETALMIMLGSYPHYIVDHTYNESSRRGKFSINTKVFHYHGNKHCRLSKNGVHYCGSEIWYKEFEEIRTKISNFIKYDYYATKFLRNWDAAKLKKQGQ